MTQFLRNILIRGGGYFANFLIQLFSQFFRIIKIVHTYGISRSYLADVAAA